MSPHSSHPNTLSTWLRTGLGQSLVRAETRCLEPLLEGCYGPVAVQFGSAEFGSFLGLSDAAFCYHAALESGTGGASLSCDPQQLPFEAGSVGLVLLPHVLEFSESPHQVLRESARILMPEGWLVLLAFNPFSLWGLAGLFRRRHAPWSGRFSPLARVKDWLKLLDFELTAGKMIYHKPPVQSQRVRRRLEFMEHAGDRWWPLGAAAFVVVARKREIGVIPLRPGWQRRRQPRPGLARPVAGARRVANE